MPVYTWLDPQRASYSYNGFSFVLVPGWTHPCTRRWWQNLRRGGVGPLHYQKVGCLCHQVLILGASYTLNTFTLNALPGYGRGPGHRHFTPKLRLELASLRPGLWLRLSSGYVSAASTPVKLLLAQ